MSDSFNHSNDPVLIRCNGSFLTFYLDAPANGFHYYSNILYIIVNLILSTTGICFNVLVWMVYWRNKSVRTSSNMLLVVLALTDFMTNTVVQPFGIARMVNEIRGAHSCFVLIAARLSSYICCGLSLLTVAIICIERFITLAYPYRYQNILPPWRLKLIVAVTWISVLIFVPLHLGPVSYTVLSSVGNTLIVLSILTVCLTWLWVNRLVKRHNIAIASTQTPGSEKQNHSKRQEASFRATRTSYLICGAVLVFYFPTLVMLAYNATQDYNFVALFLVAPWVETVMFSNSLLNPSLLFWRKSSFRTTVNEILTRPPLHLGKV
ncbi:alpha-1A adrenergic receptor-like [Dendronephthya gigantea]|uniref:alpha-1A adrenergic receptor-like n=1 Tax=Dendronephthya gigantea TaxID=151771 RepID=UPI00106AF830|nr:alpha-1A adrenergic receptor-like [Dendronephthya gigantea]